MDALLLDLNVWLDHAFVQREGHAAANRLLALAGEKEIPLLISASSLADFFFIARQMTKQIVSSGPSTGEFARQYAWGLVDNLLDIATVCAIDQGDTWMAQHFRNVHGDFEDDLVVAAAMRCKAAYLITNDADLLRHSPVPALSAADWVALQA